MKKLISVIPIAILFIILLSSTDVFASTVPESNRSRCIWLNGSTTPGVGGNWYLILASSSYGGHDYETLNTDGTNIYYNSGRYGAGYYSSGPGDYNSDNRLPTYTNFYVQFYVSNGAIVSPSNTPQTSYSSIEDYYQSLITPTPSPTPTPIPNIWDKFYEWYYKIYGYYPADDSLFGYFKSLFESDQESSGSGGPSQHSISTHRPAPTPNPTPIPYSVIIQPNYDSSGNVINYTYNYSYTSESGETIIVTSPPDNSGNSNNNNNNNEPYNPDPLAVPTSALDAWYMFAYDENEHPNPELQNPNDDFGTGMKYIEDNIDEYDKPIDYIMAVVNSFPDEWLLLFGMGIGLIFIAGIISRFLS